MELNTKSFMMVAVGLIVGVLLIAGVVTPVIADVSSNGDGEGSGETYTNEGHGYLSATDQSTSVTFYPVSANKYSTQPDSVADRPVYDCPFYLMAKDNVFMITVVELGGATCFQIMSLDEYADSFMADIMTLNGSTFRFTPRDGSAEVSENNIMYYPTESGEYTLVTARAFGQTPAYGTYFALNNTPVYCFGAYASESFSSEIAEFVISGTVGSNTLTVFEAESDSNSAEFTLTENQISDISFPIDTVNLSVDPSSLEVNAMAMFFMILPVEVSGGSGAGVSPVLSTILSVIPLILTVGLVIGSLAFLRMKN